MFYEDLNCGNSLMQRTERVVYCYGHIENIVYCAGIMTCNCRKGGQGTMCMTAQVADFYNRTERAKLLLQMQAILPPAEFEHYKRSSRYVAVMLTDLRFMWMVQECVDVKRKFIFPISFAFNFICFQQEHLIPCPHSRMDHPNSMPGPH